jgi:hypothetical protein
MLSSGHVGSWPQADRLKKPWPVYEGWFSGIFMVIVCFISSFLLHSSNTILFRIVMNRKMLMHMLLLVRVMHTLKFVTLDY